MDRNELAMQYYKKKFRDLCPHRKRVVECVVKAEEIINGIQKNDNAR